MNIFKLNLILGNYSSSERSQKESGSQKDYTKDNESIFKEVLNNSGLSSAKKKILKDIYDFCNKNNLEILNTTQNNDISVQLWSDTSVMSFRDPETGKQFNIFSNMLTNTNKVAFENDNMKCVLDAIREIPKDYMIVDNINYYKESGTLGFFTPQHPDGIQITHGIFQMGTTTPSGKTKHLTWYDYPKGTPRSVYIPMEMKATIVHEFAHAYDWWILGQGRTMNNWKYRYDGAPTKTARNSVEKLSTTMEQVYMKKLKSNALMKDGSKATNYDDWAKDWAKEVADCEKILYG